MAGAVGTTARARRPLWRRTALSCFPGRDELADQLTMGAMDHDHVHAGPQTPVLGIGETADDRPDFVFRKFGRLMTAADG